MTHLNEALRRLERRAASYATSGGPTTENSDGYSTDAGRLVQQAEVITIVIEVDRELTVGRCVKRLVPAHPSSTTPSPSPAETSSDHVKASPKPEQAPPDRIQTSPGRRQMSPDESQASPPAIDGDSRPTTVDAPVADPTLRAVTPDEVPTTRENSPSTAPQPLVEQPAAPARASVSVGQPIQVPNPQLETNTDHKPTVVESSIVESSITEVESREELAPISDDIIRRLEEITEPGTPQQPTTAPAVCEDEYHKTCRNLLAHMSEASCPVVLLASEEGQAGTLDLVAKLMVTLAELSEAPVLAMDACGERLGQRFNVIADGENRTRHGSDSWSDAIVQTTSPGLCLLTMGPSQTSVTAKTLREQFDDLKSRFGLIAIDAGAATNAHICSLSTVAEGSLFLVRLDVTTEDWMIQARDRVTAWGASPVGSIVTIPQRAAA